MVGVEGGGGKRGVVPSSWVSEKGDESVVDGICS